MHPYAYIHSYAQIVSRGQTILQGIFYHLQSLKNISAVKFSTGIYTAVRCKNEVAHGIDRIPYYAVTIS